MNESSLNTYIEDTYGVVSDRPWNDDEAYVFRHARTRKWFGLVMHIPRYRLTHDPLDADTVTVLNVKCPSAAHGSFLDGKTVSPAYHMNRDHWLSVIIEEAGEDTVRTLLDLSYSITSDQNGRRKTGR
ncbi:MAG: MmcQ/YjbR family DNA-binding protein [Eubacteriales bacterium]|nr:MmcQ/YjbR family DNA-binding protein [Eubacteriales bacterium]